MRMETRNFEITRRSGHSGNKKLTPKRKKSLDTKVEPCSGNGSNNVDGLGIYMRQLSNYPAVSAEEQFALAKRFQNQGDQEAACMLISSNLRLVVKIAMKLKRKWMNNNLDLIQEGNVGLMKATKKYDPDKGIKFSYYASFWIKAYILKFIMDNWRMVKIGSSQAQRNLFYNLGKEKQRLESLGISSDSETISRNLGVSKADVVEMGQTLGQHDLSLEMPYNDVSDITPKDTLPADGDGIENMVLQKETANILRKKVQEMLPTLNNRERDIINLRLMADTPLTLGKIGEKYNITRERVRQIESKLLGKIKSYIQKDIEDFSDEWIDGV